MIFRKAEDFAGEVLPPRKICQTEIVSRESLRFQVIGFERSTMEQCEGEAPMGVERGFADIVQDMRTSVNWLRGHAATTNAKDLRQATDDLTRLLDELAATGGVVNSISSPVSGHVMQAYSVRDLHFGSAPE